MPLAALAWGTFPTCPLVNGTLENVPHEIPLAVEGALSRKRQEWVSHLNALIQLSKSALFFSTVLVGPVNVTKNVPFGVSNMTLMRR